MRADRYASRSVALVYKAELLPLDEDHPMNTPRKPRRRLALLLLLLLLFGFGIARLAWPDRKLAAAMAMRRELSSPASRALPGEERREKWLALREAEKRLSPAQRRELSAESRKRRQAEMAKYFRMSRADKTRFLDEQIRRTQRPGSQASASGGGSGPGQRTDGGTRGGSDAQRDERRRERLDSTTPAERAQMAQFFRDLAARRSQLGLPMGGGPGAGR